MKNKRCQGRRLRNYLLTFHVAVYAAMCIASMHALATMPWGYSSHNMHMIPAVTLFWTVFLLAHVAVHFHDIGRSHSAVDERQIYREGFSDAMHQFADHAYDARQHMMVDDGEFQELIEKPKRYR